MRMPSGRAESSVPARSGSDADAYPSEEMMTPEPAPRISGRLPRALTPMLTTEGPTASTTETTAWDAEERSPDSVALAAGAR
jgi:hypothetical protein